MQYYVPKSGMPMYDLSRAYGLGYITNILSSSESIVRDFGHYFFVETRKTSDIRNIGKLSILTGTDLDWDSVFLTLKGTSRREKKIKEIIEFFSKEENLQAIFKKYQNLNEPQFLNSKGNGETLLQSLEIGGAKGLREDIRLSSYSKGKQLWVPREDFVLSTIGHLHFTIWKWSGKGNDFKKVSIMLHPGKEGVNIGGMGDIKDLKNKINEIARGSKAGVLATLTNTAVHIAKKTYDIQKSSRLFTPKFSSLIYSVMAGTGQQMKPFGGGIYPLEFLNNLSHSDNAGEIFDIWIDLFRVANIKGYEDMAIYLSEFITHPSMVTLERYLKIHLRFHISKDIKIKLYEEKMLAEVMKYI
ncbi:MAG: hypothetical protein QXL17_06530 [Candidatus Thermoplasmatota archaeon]